MRSSVHVRNIRALSKATALIGLAGIVTACSNDASRLDELITASVQATPNQHQIIKPSSPLSQPYPGDVAQAQEGIRVVERKVSAVAPAAAVTVAAPVVKSQLPQITPPSPPQIPAPAVSTSIPAPQSYDPSGPIVLKPRQTAPNPLRLAGVDPVTTASVATHTSAPQAAVAKPAGWQGSKGTWVNIKDGETLYNLSRRYGVPVTAIMSANNIADGNAVEAGRKILIPTYNYANSAPVSAPDNDPTTRVSRSSRGFQGQARGRVAIPKARAEAPIVAKPQPVAVQQSQGFYTVQPGDTLYGIALKTGSSVSAIKTTNNLTTDTVRIGQRLVLSNGPLTGVDQTVTGSIPRPSTSQSGQKPTVSTKDKVAMLKDAAPAAVKQPVTTKVGSFRWPAEGRLISKFGERRATGANDGIDISLPEGTPVKATEDGTVIYSGSELEDFGKLILLSHKGGWVSAYAHASSTLVRRGQKVRRGQVIAKSGKTGNATVPKLHFELRKDSNPVNPLKHLVR